MEKREKYRSMLSEHFEKDTKAFSDALPGIVCYGDSLTAGLLATVTYPMVLEDEIKKNICEKYDAFRFLSEEERIYAKENFKETFTLNTPHIVNAGISSENSPAIAVRSGGTDAEIAADFIIPAEKDVFVNISIRDKLTSNGCAIRTDCTPIKLNGIKGRLVFFYENYTLRFARYENGKQTAITAGTNVEFENTEYYDDYIKVVFSGGNSGFNNANELIRQQESTLLRKGKNKDKFIVIGLHFAYGHQHDEIVEISRVQKETFGDKFFDLLEYLTTDALSDAGITPTEDDKENLTNGVCPKSLIAEGDICHFNNIAYNIIGRKLYKIMDSLGYFDEAKTAVGISK